jgi:hypothetical protein
MKKKLENEEDRIDYPRLDNYIGSLLAKIFLKAPNDELRTVFIRILDPRSIQDHSIKIMNHVLISAVSSSVSLLYFPIFFISGVFLYFTSQFTYFICFSSE